MFLAEVVFSPFFSPLNPRLTKPALIQRCSLSRVCDERGTARALDMVRAAERLQTVAGFAKKKIVFEGEDDAKHHRKKRRLLATAVAARKQREEVVSVATWVSYVLYTLGWSLGLAGRLYGEDDGEMAE